MFDLARRTAQTRSSDPLPRAAPPKREASLPGTPKLGHDFGRIDILSPRQQSAPSSLPAAAPRAAPLRYDATNWTLSSPDPSFTEAFLESRLSSLLTSYSVSGIKPGMPADTRLFLLYDLRQVCARENWGQEMDIVAPVTRSTTGGADPVGRITVRIDEKGNGSVELIESGAVPAVPSTPMPADVHFSNVRGEGAAKWKTSELDQVAAALAIIPTADRKALDGAELVRVESIPNGIAQFATGTISADELSVVPATLQVANGAFDNDPRFYGGAKGTVSSLAATIVHEVGHAVANAEMRVAREARNAAYVESKNAKTSSKYTKAVTKYTKADTAYKKTVVDAKFVTAMQTDAADKKKVAATQLSGAASSLAFMKKELVKSTGSYIDQIEMTNDAIEQYETDAAVAGADLVTLEKKVKERMKFRDNEAIEVGRKDPSNPLLARYEKVAEAQDAWFFAVAGAARAPSRSLRLQKFVELVNKEKIVPFTQYGRDNWPHNPAEFYSDAYSMWLTDPEFLQTNYKAIFEFFEGGDYRK